MSIKRTTAHAISRELAAQVEGVLAATTEQDFHARHFISAIDAGRVDVAAFARHHMRTFEQALVNGRLEPERATPRRVHRIWLTSDAAPSLPPQELLEACLAQAAATDPNEETVFWTNEDSAADYIQRKARDAKTVVSVRRVEEFSTHPAYAVFTQLTIDRKFALAADLLKVLALQSHGGVYADLGVSISAELMDLVCVADYSLILGQNGFFQLSFMGGRAESPVFSLIAATMAHPEVLAASVPEEVGARDTSAAELSALAGPGATAVLLLAVSRDDRVLIIPPESQRHSWRSNRSWYAEAPLFGNAPPLATPPSVLSAPAIKGFDDAVQATLDFYGDLGPMRRLLEIVVPNLSYFEQQPTPLCRSFWFNGSDKALGWHNYSPLYYFIFAGLPFRSANFLEIGIGTNNLDVPSSMGVTGVPGASLRAWRDFLRNGAVFGADIDRRILFEEEAIRTFFVDQTDRTTISDLMKAVGRRLDVIIDDGLHEFSANINVLEGVISSLAPDGMFVVEDVLDHDVPQWKAYLEAHDYDAAMAHLPHDFNRNDNRLIIVRALGWRGAAMAES